MQSVSGHSRLSTAGTLGPLFIITSADETALRVLCCSETLFGESIFSVKRETSFCLNHRNRLEFVRSVFRWEVNDTGS